MARPRSAGFDGQREQILAAAAELFAQRGYAGTSMNDLAAACGVSKATLYHYVRDKQQLLAQISTSHVARLEALVAEVAACVAAERLPAEVHLRTLIERFTAVYAGAQHEHRVLTENQRYLDAAQREAVRAGQRRVVQAFSEAVSALGAQAALPANALTMLLFGMLNWTFTWWKPGGSVSHAELAPVVSQLFIGGLRSLVAPAAPVPVARAATSAAAATTSLRSRPRGRAPAHAVPRG
jgi:TetR/AcrR family transcriptional regulator